MSRGKLSSRKGSLLALLILIYVILGLFFVSFYKYQLDPDGISYISIAQKYVAGDLRHAINGYWGPLLSWLLVPFLMVGIPALVSTKLVSLCIGLFTLIGLRSLSYRFKMSENIRGVILFCFVPIVLQFALWIFTPDLLLTCLLVYYLNIIFRGDYHRSRVNGGLCGGIGGLAYLAKAYAFPFFLCHFLVLNILHYLGVRGNGEKKQVMRNFIIGMAVFSVLSVPWSCTISRKYGQLTIGMGGKYSWRVVGPESGGQAVLYLGFIEPPNETAISGWEDPSYIEMPSWSPLESWSHLFYAVRLILRNVYAIVTVCGTFSALSAAIIIGYILICTMPVNKLLLGEDGLYPLLTVLLYGCGYTLFLIQPRYLWPICFLLVPMGGHLLYRLFENQFFNSMRRALALIIFALSFVAIPVGQLVRDMNIGKDVYRLSKMVGQVCNIDGRVASQTKWRESLYLAYHLNFRYYGIPRPGTSEAELAEELKRKDIDYLIVWDGHWDDLQFLSGRKEMTGGKVPRLRIYYLGEENKSYSRSSGP